MAQISPHTKPNRDLVVFVLSVGLLVSSLGRAAADFGDALPGLTPEDQGAFEEGLEEFTEEETVEEGLGPVFNERFLRRVPFFPGDWRGFAGRRDPLRHARQKAVRSTALRGWITDSDQWHRRGERV